MTMTTASTATFLVLHSKDGLMDGMIRISEIVYLDWRYSADSDERELFIGFKSGEHLSWPESMGAALWAALTDMAN